MDRDSAGIWVKPEDIMELRRATLMDLHKRESQHEYQISNRGCQHPSTPKYRGVDSPRTKRDTNS